MMWFEALFGFPEASYAESRSQFRVLGNRLHSRVNDRSFRIGEFSTPRLEDLRAKGRATGSRGVPRITHEAVDDVLELHAQQQNRGALFQVASQFNCLEFSHPGVTPEEGVTGYVYDLTQGPACSLASAAGTVFRNYFAPVRGSQGQTWDNQIDNLEDLSAALGRPDEYWSVRNGYTSSTPQRLAALRHALEGRDREQLLGQLRIGIQYEVGVDFIDRFTQVDSESGAVVSQAFCSAISCSYTNLDNHEWEPLARLVLDATYEATLWAAAVNAAREHGTNKVWLTFIGGGVFGNDFEWIADAIGRAIGQVSGIDLDIRIAHYRNINSELEVMITEAVARYVGNSR
ncbi:MAG: hypothetical protein ACI841_003815 [Planctomycetota bacterium]|jgi:hypothetical protein